MDTRDEQIKTERSTAYLSKSGPQVGHIVERPGGQRARVAHVWPDCLQLTWTGGDGSFYLGKGYAEYSGGLEPGIDKHLFRPTGRQAEARFWFFHHDYATAHNGVNVTVNVPIWELSGK